MNRITNLSHIQSFHAVALAGSLAAAVRAGMGSQATLSRHIASLEEELRVTLFERRGDGYALTQTGERLLEHAENINNAANGFEIAATEQEQGAGGTIRITASRGVAGSIFPDILATLAMKEPEIEVEIVPSDKTANLLMREADIAIRMFRPTQANLFACKIGDLQFGAYASTAYINRCGAPESLDDLKNHDLIGEDQNDQLRQAFKSLGVDMPKNAFRFRCDDITLAWKLVLAGCGVGVAQTRLGDATPHIKRILSNLPEIGLPVWLVSHSELKTNPRVRRVYDLLAYELRRSLSSK